MLSTIQ